MRLDKPIGILLLLWPTLWGLWIAADGFPPSVVLLVFLAGVVLMRSAGCIINDYADREVDRHVRRTINRPITSGAISAKHALIMFLLLVLISFGLVLLMNQLVIQLSFGAIVLATLYPFMKRYTDLPQLFLGAAFGWAIPMAFAAVTGSVPMTAWILFLATLCWAVVYDTMYAMVDREDDLKVGVRSTAILFGSWDRFMIGLFQLIMLGLLVLAGDGFELGGYYNSGLLTAAALAGYHQWLIRNREPQRCFQAFLHNHWIGLAVFVGIVVDVSA
ncbi:MAG: 4-hydroxybenzoate octaprenyltransferase [Gammaproteobacteria bacterium]|jgi:4-hydroxybenzoate polyprenyltransferase|nr:4-hydroxybenzoate octaprenyltransferase [Gammaproteobacteria bacterium]MBT3489267.1 4-hydroxybenzoate octaprenyltransferase [Gammaproteobacteria bacterium]MBT3717805.1 4-hydroxybenzoate octaprenyltransferase [Gammaproteobacteria bacterium]MBT3845982.1 4-hydroxybenzoate octaprenyltransferase [Gammaproteobacteria bacterium]MBT3893799.1 4-hydroxybenzoate octaprenyltransferase [Gammaproteobacteria bacterium]